ncbi:hypothetical protein [Stieleria sp.]|uniref:hypothetical protein n=1 Tax=Stieleria sp. TaxID=2795976 RepID=UPI00356528B4
MKTLLIWLTLATIATAQTKLETITLDLAGPRVVGVQTGDSPEGVPHTVYAESIDLVQSAEAIRKLRYRPPYSLASPPVWYPGYQPRNTPRPLDAPVVGPVGSVPEYLDPAMWIAEEPSQPRTPWYHAIPYFYRDASDDVRVGSYFSKSGSTVETAVESVEHSVAWDGMRNVNLVSPYATYRPTPDDGSGRDHRGWLGLDLSGRLWHAFADGTVVTIAGPRTVAGRVPDLRGGPKEIVGEFPDGPLSSPVDFVACPCAPGMLFIADTENQRICLAAHIGETTRVWEHRSLGFRPFSIDMHGTDQAIADINNHRVWINGEPIEDPLIQDPSVVRYDSQGNLIVGCRVSKKILRIDREHHVTELATLGQSGRESWLWLDVDKRGNCLPQDTIVIQNSVNARNWTQIILPDGTLQTWRHPAFSDYAWAIAIDDTEARMVVSGFGDTSGVMQIRARTDDPQPRRHADVLREKHGWDDLRASADGRLIGPTGANFLGYPTRFDLETWTADEIKAEFPSMSDNTIFALQGGQ